METTLRYVLSYLIHTQPSFVVLPSIKLTILADNDYYSQPPSTTPLPQFNPLGVTLSEAHKTGLGSSAALITSLTACLFSTYSPSGTPFDVTAPTTQKIIHNLAQASHCAAQGKIGSGFDVAAAVFGSCVYRRFSPSILEPATSADTSDPEFPAKLSQIVTSPWDFSVAGTRVPPGFRLVMGDVDCGSSTPGMVRKVLYHRTSNPQSSKSAWDSLSAHNASLITLLAQIERKSTTSPSELSSALASLRTQVGPFTPSQIAENPTLDLFAQTRNKILDVRKEIKALGDVAGVPIEPQAQTRLLDHLVDNCPGVIGGVVPGAGGFDAIAVLVVDDEEVLSTLRKTLEGWRFESEGDGVTKRGGVKVMDTREEHEGLKREKVEGYGL